MDVVVAWLRRSLWETVPRDHRQTPADLRRRQVTTAAFAVLGALMLGISLHLRPGSLWFYPATLALAAIWVLGAFASGPLHLGRIADQRGLVRPLVAPVAIGLALAGICVLGALVVREIPFLDHRVAGVLEYTRAGSLPVVVVIAVINGVAEELFFRGALYAAITRHPLVWTSVAYTIVTLATGNVMLGLAAVLLGVVVALERRASGGVLAPVLTHVSWSIVMLLALPPLFG